MLWLVDAIKTLVVAGSASLLDSSRMLRLNRLADTVRVVLSMAMMGGSMFVVFYWPVPEYTPEGFQEWAKSLSVLPEPVWYLLLGMFFGYGFIGLVMALNRPTRRKKRDQTNADE